MDAFETKYSYSLHIFFFSEFWNLHFLIFYEFSSHFHWNHYVYSFQWILLELVSLPLAQSAHDLLFRILKLGFLDFFYEFLSNFHFNLFFYSFQSILSKQVTVIHILFFSEFANLDFLIFFYEFSSNFNYFSISLTSLVLLQFSLCSFETWYSYSLEEFSVFGNLEFFFYKGLPFLSGLILNLFADSECFIWIT